MNATFYNFTKRVNSTKVPDASVSGTAYNVVFKMPTSRRNPTIRINADAFNFNYCLLEGKYYFVTDIVSVRNDLWDVNLSIDVLGSYRAEILATTAYVLYDTTANTEIVDSRLAIEATPSVDSAQTEITQLDGDGVYALCVVGKYSTDTWILPDTTALLDVIDLKASSIISSVLPQQYTNEWEQLKANIDFIGDAIVQFLSSGKAVDCIRSCRWLPWSISGDSAANHIFLGNYETNVYGSRVETPNVLFTYQITIPWQTSDWRRLSPYTQVYLYLPFIGIVNIPTATIKDYARLTVEYCLSKITGELSVIVAGGDSGLHPIGVYQGNSGTPVPFGNSNITPAARSTGLIQAAGAVGAIASGGIAAGAAGLVGLMSGMSNMMVGVPSTVGTASGGTDAGLPRYIECITVFHDTNVQPNSVAASIGTPTFAQKALSSVTGYVQCHEASVQGVAMLDDYEAINNYLNTGVFIE
ncbi:MAG: hypothetical protein IKG04_01430 [Exiguobacterium sp.]|nr:hypothetical protein [Exiguobacterium sp.]